MRLIKKEIKHGDTIVEVMLSIAIFSAVALLTINIMNSGLNTAQTTLEATMARAAIDAQSETIRFIHNSYTAERNYGLLDSQSTSSSEKSSQFEMLWKAMLAKVGNQTEITTGKINSNIEYYDTCGDAMRAHNQYSFVVNPRFAVPRLDRNLDYSYGGVKYSDIKSKKFVVSNPASVSFSDPSNVIRETSLYPRLIYAEPEGQNLKIDETVYEPELIRSEGVWNIAFGDKAKAADSDSFDFYLNVCWNAPGRTRPSSITTIVRVHNPEK